MFKRRNSESGSQEQDDVVVEEEAVVDAADGQPVEASGIGPWDISEAPEDELARIDLGGLQIPIIDNMQLHLQGHNEESDSFASAVVVLEDQQSALELMAVAAPRSGEFWPEVMDELEAQITQAGGTMSRAEGRFGPEMRGKVPAQDAEGNQALEDARFVAAEGPRWFIRGMLMGAAATNEGLGEFFEDIIASCIVNRGERPMAPGDLIPLTPPVGVETEEETEEVVEETTAYEDLEPFERGPEITETR